MWIFVLTTSLLCWVSEAVVTCKNNNDATVDWFIIYKTPSVAGQQLTGLTYLYIDSTGAKETTPNNKLIDSPTGILANTLRPLFVPVRQMPATFGYISYSDQPPGRTADQAFGHSKGVLLVDSRDYGVWLMHSLPQFPYKKNRNTFWPPTGADNAQTFICVTVPYNQFEYVGQHLQYIKAYPYDHDLPTNFNIALRDVVNDWKELQPPTSVPLTIRGNTRVRIFAKDMADSVRDGDLYVAIGQHFRSDVFAQTWGGQTRRDQSFCENNLPNVYNVKDILTDVGTWKPSCDHSKWCVLDNQNNNWVCIADVNRSGFQYWRRGGALCIESQVAKAAFRNAVASFERCGAPVSTDSCDRRS